jgi:hypothetical protein
VIFAGTRLLFITFAHGQVLSNFCSDARSASQSAHE